MTNEQIRPAVAADVPAVKAVTDAAYRHYIERIGVVPLPMRADHAANVSAGKVFVAGDPVVGLVVIEAHEDHLFLDSIAVHPDAHGGGCGPLAGECVRGHFNSIV
jgi:ribosomal protein S18 acetylase RimI-like enzyme